jgi:hypothetical protein
VKVRLIGATIVPVTTTHIVPDKGHLHLMLDGQIVSMNFKPTATIPVKPGTHLLVVEYVAADHGPFNPRDYAPPVQFTVKA